MRFAQFHVGQCIESAPYEVRQQEILSFARQWDPQWFHTDPDAARSGPFEGLIASGWHTCAIAMRLAAQTALVDSDSFVSPGLSYLKWPNPVRPGDRVRLVATVLDTRRTRSGLGALRWRWQMFNQAGTEVLDLEATTLFKP